jgi:hypothetical protein
MKDKRLIPYKKCVGCGTPTASTWILKKLTYNKVFIDSPDTHKYSFKVKSYPCGSYMVLSLRSKTYTLIKRCPKDEYLKDSDKWIEFEKELNAQP